MEACLEEYSEFIEFLKPPLELAVETCSLLAPSEPDKAFASNTKIRIFNQLQAQQRRTEKVAITPRRVRRWVPRPAFALLSLAIVLAMLFSGIGVAGASANALPGDALYGVKRGIEEARLTFTLSVIGDAELLTELTAARLGEIETLINSGRETDLPIAIKEYEAMLTRLLTIADDEALTNEAEILDKIHFGLSHHENVLQRVLENAPPAARKGLENAIEKSGHGKAVIEQIQSGGSPSDLAPGQQKKTEEPPGRDKPTKTPKSKPKDDPSGQNGKPKDKTPDPPHKDNPDQN